MYWSHHSNIDFLPLLNMFLESDWKGGVLCSGKGWPKETTIEKFVKLLARRRMAELETVSMMSEGEPPSNYFRLSLRKKTINHFALFSDGYELNSRILASLNWLCNNVQMCYGLACSPVQGYVLRSGPSDYSYIKMGENPTAKGIMKYESARTSWEYLHILPKEYSRERVMQRLFLVFPLNILTRVHLDGFSTEGGLSLREFILQSDTRGTLERFPHDNYQWHVDCENLEQVVRDIWKTGLLPGSDKMQIAGWDAESGLPVLVPKEQ